MKAWISVTDAAELAKRDVRTIYRWIDEGLLVDRAADQGGTEVLAAEVLKVEATRRRGRPRKSSNLSNVPDMM